MTEREDLRPLILIGLLVASAAVHGLTFVALGWMPLPGNVARELASVNVDVIEPPPEPEPAVEEPPAPEPEPEPELAEPEPPPPREPPPPEEAPPEEPPDEPPPPAEETPVAFDNIVLTNDTGESSFSVQQASGVDREGPIGTPGAQVTGRSRRGQPGGTPGGTGEPDAPRGPRVVAMADLSQDPTVPGSLPRLVERNYPREARQQGIAGKARVRIVINPDGSLRVGPVLSETWDGFGEACQRALRQSPRWGRPLGERGERVAVRSHFECTFDLY